MQDADGQIGKSFRNEITPGNFIFRIREFEQMELEFFCKPDHMPRCHPHLRIHQDGRIQPDVVGGLLYKLFPPGALPTNR